VLALLSNVSISLLVVCFEKLINIFLIASHTLLVTVVCFPLGQYLEEEDTDRPELALPGDQLQLLKDAIYYSKSVTIFVSRLCYSS